MRNRTRSLLLQPCQSQTGLALIIVLIVTIALTLLGSIGYQLTIGRRNRVVAVKEKAQALAFAEAAIDDVRARMLPDGNLETAISALGVGVSTSTTGGLAGDECTIVITKMVGTDKYRILSTYSAAGTALRSVEVIVEADYSSVFNHAACGCASLEINGSTDSYDSDSGTYAAQVPSDSGDVGSNGHATLKGTVDGDLEAGGDITAASTSSGIVTGDARLGGAKLDSANCAPKSCISGTLLTSLSPVPAPCDCSSIDVNTMVTSAAATNDNNLLPAPYTGATTLNLAGGDNLTISSGGTYYFTSIDIGGSATITISTADTVTFVLGGSGTYDFGGNGIVNSSANASNFLIYSNSTGDIDFHGGSEFSALVYAPSANINLAGNFDVYGAFLGNVFYGNGTTDVHYDGAAEDLDMVLDAYAIKSWRDDKSI